MATSSKKNPSLSMWGREMAPQGGIEVCYLISHAGGTLVVRT